MDRAFDFYTNILGFTSQGRSTGITLLKAPSAGQIMIYERPPSKADHTVLSIVVDDLEAAVRDLMSHSVVFERYETQWATWDTELPIATTGPARAAWFTDTEGNILALNNKVER